MIDLESGAYHELQGVGGLRQPVHMFAHSLGVVTSSCGTCADGQGGLNHAQQEVRSY